MTRIDPTDKTDEKPDADWVLLDVERVAYVQEAVASKIASDLAGITTYDDAYQDAAILIATNPEVVDGYLEDSLYGERSLYKWLEFSLRNEYRTDQNHAQQSVSYEGLDDYGADE